jgi:hypothetical protein
MAKARIYLDFDGVINADKPRFDDVVTFAFTVKERGLLKRYTINYSPTMLNLLSALLTKHDVEVVWLSTWNENLEILKVMRKIGMLPGGRVINIVMNSDWDTNRAWTKWKADKLVADLKGDDMPFIWVDDEAHKYHKADVVAAVGHNRHMLVSPRSYWGLTPGHLAGMDAFLSSL